MDDIQSEAIFCSHDPDIALTFSVRLGRIQRPASGFHTKRTAYALK